MSIEILKGEVMTKKLSKSLRFILKGTGQKYHIDTHFVEHYKNNFFQRNELFEYNLAESIATKLTFLEEKVDSLNEFQS